MITSMPNAVRSRKTVKLHTLEGWVEKTSVLDQTIKLRIGSKIRGSVTMLVSPRCQVMHDETILRLNALLPYDQVSVKFTEHDSGNYIARRIELVSV